MSDPITNFVSLQAAFENYVARPDLTEYLPYFVQQTEAWLNRKLRTREMTTRGVLTARPDQSDYLLPADYLEWIGVEWTDATLDTRKIALRYVEPDSPEFRHRFRPNGSPQFFTVLSDSLVTRSYKPGGLVLTYYRRIPALTAAAPTNFLLTLAPELYLYGAVAESYRFQKDEENSAKWAADAQGRLEALIGQGDAQKVSRRPTRAAEDQAEALARNTPN